MPLLGKKPFSSGSQLKSNSSGPVFVIPHTKEQFSSESEFKKRKDLYAQNIWTCRATGHINLIHEEAMKSEEAVALHLEEEFTKCFEKDVLEIVHHNTQSLDSLVDQTWLKCHQELVVGERVNLKVKVADKLIPAKVVSVDKSSLEAKNGNGNSNCNSPSSDKENNTDETDKGPKKWTPPKLLPYMYSIELDKESKVIHSIPADDLVRLDRVPSKDLLRLFIRVSALRSGNFPTSPWVVNADLVKKYKLVNKFNDFFLSPVKMAEAAKRAEENKKKRKLSNGSHVSSCKKIKLDKKSKESPMQKNKTGKKGKDSVGDAKKSSNLKSPKKVVTPKKTSESVILVDSDEDVALPLLKKKSKARESDSDSDIPLYQLANQTTPKKKKEIVSVQGSSDEDVPLAKITSKKSTPKKKETSSKTDDGKKKTKDGKKLAKAHKTGMKQATLFDLSKKGKTVLQRTPSKKTPTKSTPMKSGVPPTPAIVRRLQNAKRDSLADKMKYNLLLKTAVKGLSAAELSRVPEKLREDIERKKLTMEEKVKMSRMTAEEREEYLKEKRLKAKQVSKEKLLQKLKEKRKRFEDTELNLSPLPSPKMVPTPDGFPNDQFGEVAMVTECINCYSGLLMPDSEYPIFSDPLMKALVGGSNGFTYLSRVLTVMLQTLLQDEITKGYKELSTLLSDIPVSQHTASELMRLCFTCEGEDEEDEDVPSETIQLLSDYEFYQLELDQKLMLLRGLCSRVLETYSVQDYMEEQQKKAVSLSKQRISEMKQITAQLKSEKTDSPTVKPTETESNKAESTAKENSDSAKENGCLSITSFYGKEAAADSGEDTNDWGSIVKRRRILAAKAAADKEKQDKEKMAQREKETQLEKARRKQDQMEDDINLARMVLRQEPIGTDRHHDRYWVFTNTTPGLYIEKGWMGDEVNYLVAKTQSSRKTLDDDDWLPAGKKKSNVGSDNAPTADAGLKKRNIIYKEDVETSVPHPGQNMWLTYRSVKDLDALLDALHPQGIRESSLLSEIKKRYDDIVKAINLAQRANLELRSIDGDVEMVSSFKKELYDIELRLRNGGLGGVSDFTKWEAKLNDTSNIDILGECLLEVKTYVTDKFLQGFMKPEPKTEDIKEEEKSEEEEEGDEETKTNVKESKNEKALRLWEEAVSSCQTLSRLHVLLAMLDSCIKWEKSAENARCKICRKKGNDDCLLLCDECNQAFHLYCLRPALSKVPTTDWFCPACKPRRSTAPENNVESEEEEEEEKDEACRECGGKDELVVCSKCPSAYHTECHDPPLKRPPRGAWECSDCSNGGKRRGGSRRGGSRRANKRQKVVYQESSGDDDADEESEEEEEEEEEEREPAPKSRSRTRKSNTSSTRSRERKASSRNTSLRESTGTPSHTPTSRVSKRGPSELSLCEEVLSRVVKHKSSWPFREPVDKKEVPDYHLYVKKPMDFQTMQKNCARLNYASPQEFIEDAALVFENAESYNKSDSEVYKCMRDVEKLFKDQLNKLLPDWPYYRTVIEHDSSSGSETGKRRSRNK